MYNIYMTKQFEEYLFFNDLNYVKKYLLKQCLTLNGF